MGRRSAFVLWLISVSLILSGTYMWLGLPKCLVLAGIFGLIMTGMLYDPAAKKSDASWRERMSHGLAGRGPRLVKRQ